MQHPIAIEAGGEGSAFRVVVPDLPGCFSAATRSRKPSRMRARPSPAWIDAELDAGRSVPEPGDLGRWQRKRDYRSWAWRSWMSTRRASTTPSSERINITLPRRVLSKLDAAVGETRSGYIARLALTR